MSINLNVLGASFFGKPLRNRGFTMVELLLVVVLLSVIAAVAVPNFSQTYKQVVVKKSVDDLVYTMRYAQSRAVTKRRVHQLRFDGQYTKYWIVERTENSVDDNPVFERIASRRGRVMLLPESVKIENVRQSVSFYPDGRIERVRIYLTAGERVYTVSTMEQRGTVHVLDYKLEGS